jgi:hypothetical protein
MYPEYINCNVRARCPDCGGSITTFEHKVANKEFGTIVIDKNHIFKQQNFKRILYILMRCAGCGRGGLAKIHDNGMPSKGILESFYPISIDEAKIPSEVPQEIEKEYREAEFCASFGAWRAASALLRSTLEKTLKVNGYKDGSLNNKIDEAAKDGIITESRRKKAHEDIRVLGNDVLHEEWREITKDEVEASHHYVQRIIEDFYDDRTTVEALLKQKGKIT